MINQNTTPSVICFGEVLWDVLADGPQPGGAPMNVAYHLSRLGINTGIVSSVGNDEKGLALLHLLDRWGINRDLVQVNAQYHTSEVLARTSNKTEVTYEILFPVAWDFITLNEEMVRYTHSCDYLVFGSLASRNDISGDSLLQLMDNKAIKVLDVNLRYPFVDQSKLSHLLKHADIVKFNDQELQQIQGFYGGEYRTEQDQLQFIQDTFNIPELIVTKGAMGASYCGPNQYIYESSVPVNVEDTIGSGDAFLAGFIANHHLGGDQKKMMFEAIAMGGFIATRKGGCPEYSDADFHQFKLA